LPETFLVPFADASFQNGLATRSSGMKGTYVATMGAQVAKRDPALHAISEQGNSSTQAKIVGVCGGAAVVAASLASRRRRINRKRLHKKMVMHSTSTATIPTTETSPSSAPWMQFGKGWEVHKFGGASLNDAELYKTCGDLLISESSQNTIPTAAVVSAAGGMTDALVGVITASVESIEEAEEKLNQAIERQTSILLELVPNRPDLTDPVIANFQSDRKGIKAMLTAVHMMRGVPPQTLELVAGLGEVWSAQTLKSYLKFAGQLADWVDARDVLIVADTASLAGLGEKGVATDTINPIWGESSDRLASWWKTTFGEETASAPFLVITGFVCSTLSGRPTTLKRSGSDYSATIFAKMLSGTKVTMWKNVNGVYTADPRRVPDARTIPSMTFDEAMELAYFGGQVLHPSAMVPCIEKRIPVSVRNVFNPSHPGTRVYGRGDDCFKWDDQEDEDESEDMPVKAITSIEKVAVVTLSGASFLGTPGVGKRMMEALGNAGVNVILTSQGSSEHSITVAVDENQEVRARECVAEAFQLEIARNDETRVTSMAECSILAVIGEGMKKRPGISGRFFSSLGQAKVNVIAIAQGSSERNISAVVPRAELSRALRAVHSVFTLSDVTVAVGIIGSGMVGTQLLKMLSEFQDSIGRNRSVYALAEVRQLKIEVRGVCDVNKMLLADHGVPLGTLCADEELFSDMRSGTAYDVQKWEDSLKSKGKTVQEALSSDMDTSNSFEVKDTDLDAFVDFMDIPRIPQIILIDSTASDKVASMYPSWLKRGLHIISPNKQAGGGPLERFKAIQEAALRNRVQWRCESTVGAQIPVLSLLRDMLQTGDTITKVAGVVSGTSSYIFGVLSQDSSLTFSEAVNQARLKGITEPDPRQDLSGKDTARKALLLARELGLLIELEDVVVESLIPSSMLDDSLEAPSLRNDDVGDRFVSQLKDEVDASIAARIKTAADQGEVLRYVGEVDMETKSVSVGLKSYPLDHPLASVKESEIAVTFTTHRYPAATPLVVRGPGAGAEVTASAVFADLLRLSMTVGS